jgi:hypothetical protein
MNRLPTICGPYIAPIGWLVKNSPNSRHIARRRFVWKRKSLPTEMRFAKRQRQRWGIACARCSTSPACVPLTIRSTSSGLTTRRAIRGHSTCGLTVTNSRRSRVLVAMHPAAGLFAACVSRSVGVRPVAGSERAGANGCSTTKRCNGTALTSGGARPLASCCTGHTPWHGTRRAESANPAPNATVSSWSAWSVVRTGRSGLRGGNMRSIIERAGLWLGEAPPPLGLGRPRGDTGAGSWRRLSGDRSSAAQNYSETGSTWMRARWFVRLVSRCLHSENPCSGGGSCA